MVTKNAINYREEFRWVDGVSDRLLSGAEEEYERDVVRRCEAARRYKKLEPTMEQYAWFRVRPELQVLYNVGREIEAMQFKPGVVVCLCGSSKFRHEMHQAALDETH